MNNQKWAKVVAKALANEQFKNKLKQNPHQILAEADINVDTKTQIEVIEDSDKVLHIALPTTLDQSNLPKNEKITEILKKALSNTTFKQQLKANPHQVLKDSGVDVKDKRKIIILENSDHLRYLILPYVNLTEMAGGSCQHKPFCCYSDCMEPDGG